MQDDASDTERVDQDAASRTVLLVLDQRDPNHATARTLVASRSARGRTVQATGRAARALGDRARAARGLKLAPDLDLAGIDGADEVEQRRLEARILAPE
jgi:hypothetical protein